MINDADSSFVDHVFSVHMQTFIFKSLCSWISCMHIPLWSFSATLGDPAGWKRPTCFSFSSPAHQMVVPGGIFYRKWTYISIPMLQMIKTYYEQEVWPFHVSIHKSKEAITFNSLSWTLLNPCQSKMLLEGTYGDESWIRHDDILSEKITWWRFPYICCCYFKTLKRHICGPRDCHTEWRKSDRERQISCDIAYTWNLKKGYKWTYLQNRSWVTDVENKLMVTRG